MSWRNGMLDERMEEQNKKKNRPRPPEDEEMETEMERPPLRAAQRAQERF